MTINNLQVAAYLPRSMADEVKVEQVRGAR